MGRPVVNRFPNGQALASAVAEDLFKHLSNLLRSQERVDIALTGGTIGIAALAACREFPFAELDLNRVHFWWGDERFVDSESDERNAVQAKKAWLSHLNLSTANIHEFPSSDNGLDLDVAAQNFTNYFDAQHVSFDLMLMGMGPDGHIASLFPGKNAGTSSSSVISEPDSPKPPKLRLSFNYKTINNAKQIWFTVSGADKADAVASVFTNGPENLPASRVSGEDKTVWYLDQTAGNLVFGC